MTGNISSEDVKTFLF